MLVAFAYNLRHSYASTSDPKSQLEADFDDQLTIDAMINNLKACGWDVLPVEANEQAYDVLYKKRNDISILFNYSLGLNGKDRYAHIPAICEMLKIPYTGSGPLTQALVMNKARAKEILFANGVPTLPFQIFKTGKEQLDKHLKFPLIVKPVGQGSSAGITNKSVVNSEKELVSQVDFVTTTFGETALVEPFIDGREFSVAMLGNPPEILPLIESDHSVLPKGFLPLDSLEVKWEFEVAESAKNLICPAKVDKELAQRIEKICKATWEALSVTDLARIDLRCDKRGNMFVLEVNSPPGLIPEEVFVNSYFPLASRAAGLTYQDVLKSIVSAAMKRYAL